jgi:hypothetical protein
MSKCRAAAVLKGTVHTMHLRRRAPVVDSHAEELIVDHARWLIERHDARLASIEARAGYVVGWGATQATLSIAAIGLSARVASTPYGRAGVIVLDVAVMLTVAAAVVALFGALRPSDIAAPQSDWSTVWDETVSDTGATRSVETARVLGRNLVLGKPATNTHPTVVGYKLEVDRRARSLRVAFSFLVGSIAITASALFMFSLALLEGVHH